MRALEHIVEAGALDKVTELSKKVGEVNLYISRLFQNKHENLASNVNTAFRFKIDTRDTHLVEEWVEDDDKFHRVVQAISNKLNESPRACLNWWNQSLLILAIAAAEARNRENVPVVEDVCALLDDSIINVIKTYDKIIKKLKEIWMKRSVWHRIGRRISEIWAKLKTLLLGIPNKIIDKISIIQHKVDNDPDLKDRIVDKAKFVISHTISTILMMFSGVQESVIRLIRFAGTATISKTQDKVLRDLVGLMTSKKAQYTIHGFRTFTRPAFTTIGQPLKYTDEPLKTVLDNIVIQIRASRYAQAALRKAFVALCHQYENPNYTSISRFSLAEIDALKLKMTRKDFLYQIPFTNEVVVFSGNQRQMAAAFESDFTKVLLKQAKGKAPKDYVHENIHV